MTEECQEHLTDPPRRCSYKACNRLESSTQFHVVEGSSKAGGQDWEDLADRVLCSICYDQFKSSGSLERFCHQCEPVAASTRRCSYQGCKRPDECRRFYQIDGRSTAGGQDWKELAGIVLCENCYRCFSTHGKLERTGYRHEPLAASARRCSYEGCKRPDESRQFCQIDGRSTAGGQDWTELEGSVLCLLCYQYFWKNGTLKRSQHRLVSNRARQCSKRPTAQRDIKRHTDAHSTFSSSSKKTKRGRHDHHQQHHRQEAGEGLDEQEYDPRLKECFMCLGSGQRICIVPCGHSVCGDCGDARLFKKVADRPFKDCPVCRASMCQPWVMDGEEWVKLGRTVYDP